MSHEQLLNCEPIPSTCPRVNDFGTQKSIARMNNERLRDSAPDLLASCLALIEIMDGIEQSEGISMLEAQIVHEAKIATLNAQGIVEEGYND